MRAAAVMQYVNIALFTSLAVVCFRLARRHRTQAAYWAAVTFGVIGVVSLAGLVVPDEPDTPSTIVVKILLLGILAYPYALYRFSASFERLPRGADVVVAVLTVAVGIATLALPRLPGPDDDVRPLWFQLYAFVFLVDWVGIGVVVARRLWSAGRGLATVARYRMRTLALGAIGLALALLPGLVPAARQPLVVRAVSLALPAVSAVLFFLGLAPPAWLRAVWRRPDQAALRHVELELMSLDSRDRVFATVLPHVAALVGGANATFTAAGPPEDAGTISIPLVGGFLVVEAGPYSPFFGTEEIEMLTSLGAFLGLVLERTSLLERERLARTSAERTSAELETLVYGISHDLKSPVISLLGYLEYLREDHGSAIGTEGLYYVERMEKSALYMQELLTDLLELSRVGRVAVDTSDVDLRSLVTDVAIDVESKFPTADITVGQLPVVHVNASRARQLFTNLIENAARHGGRPDISITVDASTLGDGTAVVSVVDDGVGIPAEYREKAFGIFERLSPRESEPGTGIGLALCRKIVETSGGDIGIVDSPRGTHVRITFPATVVRIARRESVEVS